MAPTARQIESIRASGAHVEVLEIRGIKALKYLQCLPMLRTRAAAVDLIHAHFGYCGWLARAQSSTPIVVSFMGDDLLGTPDRTGRPSAVSRCVVRADCWLAQMVDAVIVKSAEMARIVAPVNAYVIPNGVDLDVFRPIEAAAARRRIGLREDRRYVLFPGLPNVPRKGFPLAQSAVTEAARRMGELLELIALQGVPPDRVALYMNACDAMLLTSLWEGSPNVVKEAMACNLPIVSVPVGDVPELLSDVEGCAVCRRDPDALADALLEIFQRSERTNGRAALHRKGLDLPTVAQRVMDVYVEVLSRKHACAA